MEDPKQDVNERPGGASGAPADGSGEAPGAPQEAAHGAAEGQAAQAPTPEERIAALQEERDRLKDQLLRSAADLDNYRKRARRDVEEAARKGCEDALREILPVIDNLERAVASAASATDVKAVAEGVDMVLRYFQDTGSKLGLERVEAVGQRFDPNLHEAIQQEETADQPPGTVLRELAAGYRLAGRLLRPAMVVVARPPAAGGGPSQGSPAEA
jgi:molecular chaperone GrpE